jgi:hypothetical protein
MRLQADLDIIAEGELKAAPHDDNRRNGLYRRQSGTGHILHEANGFAGVTPGLGRSGAGPEAVR